MHFFSQSPNLVTSDLTLLCLADKDRNVSAEATDHCIMLRTYWECQLYSFFADSHLYHLGHRSGDFTLHFPELSCS